MKVSTVLSFTAAVVVTVNAESYSDTDQAIWIDRHNFFRTTGLPWSSSNMRRIGWDADLATKAATTASKCSATTSTGINAYQSSSKNASSAIDEAIQQWVVETAVSTIKTMAQPGSNGLDVGTGVYNSYSQVVWAKTTSVGCATASCSGGELVVCEYSPAGNDEGSPWYKHAAQASECPDGTTAAGALCIDEGSDANNQIAPIPAGKNTYEVYPSFVADVQSILINSARDIANGSNPPTTQSKATSLSSTPAPKAAQTTEESTESATDPPSSKTALKTRTTDSSSASSPESSTKKEASKTTTTKSSSESPSSSMSPETQDEGPGTVKASSDTGSTFQNEVKTPTAQQANTSEGDMTQQTESLTTNNGEAKVASHGLSTLGLVSMFILGIAAVAGIVMFVHYRVSTKLQHDIVLDGGVHQ